MRALGDELAVLVEVLLPPIQGGLVHRALGGHEVVLHLLLHVELGREDLQEGGRGQRELLRRVEL